MQDTLYERVADDLRKRVLAGEFAKRRTLPTQNMLTKHYNCSARTIQKAMDILKDERLITSERGMGYYLY